MFPKYSLVFICLIQTIFGGQLKIINHSGNSINIFRLESRNRETKDNQNLTLQTPTPIEHERGAILKANGDNDYFIRFHKHMNGVEALIPKSNSDGTITVTFDKVQNKLIIVEKYRDAKTDETEAATLKATTTATNQQQQQQQQNIKIAVQSSLPKTQTATTATSTTTKATTTAGATGSGDVITRAPRSERVTLKIVNKAGAPIDFFWYDHISSKSYDRKEQKLILQNTKPIANNGESIITSYPNHAFIIRFHNHVPGVQIDFLKTSIDETVTVTYDAGKNKLISVETHKDTAETKIKTESETAVEETDSNVSTESTEDPDTNSDNNDGSNTDNDKGNESTESTVGVEENNLITDIIEPIIPQQQKVQQQVQQEHQTQQHTKEKLQQQQQPQKQQGNDVLAEKRKITSTPTTTSKTTTTTTSPTPSSYPTTTKKQQEQQKTNKPPQRERAESLNQRKYNTKQAPVSVQQQQLKQQQKQKASSTTTTSSSNSKTATNVKPNINSNTNTNNNNNNKNNINNDDIEVESQQVEVEAEVENEEDEIMRKLQESDVIRIQQQYEAKRKAEHDYHHNHHINTMQQEAKQRRDMHEKYRTINKTDHKYKVGKATTAANKNNDNNNNNNNNNNNIEGNNEDSVIESRTFIDRIEDPTMFELFLSFLIVLMIAGGLYIFRSSLIGNKFKLV